MDDLNKNYSFEKLILPHRDSAYNFARWLTRNDNDAEDIVQDAFLRAFKFFGGFRGGDSKSWLLAIVKNVFYTKFSVSKKFDKIISMENNPVQISTDSTNPEIIYLRKENAGIIKDAIENLPLEFREVIILREMEDLSYKEISDILQIPAGTVMSRLARARKNLYLMLADQLKDEDENEL